MSPRFAIVGAGKVGAALARLLAAAGYEFLGAASRSIGSARAACQFAGAGRAAADALELTRRADIVLITTPDDAIRQVCQTLADAGGFCAGAVVAHCSGALPSTVLQSARTNGAHVGSLHPLQTFATAEQAVAALPGAWCCIEGDAEAVGVLEDLARALRMHVMTIPTEGKTLYHAAAVMASNYLVALEHAALRLSAEAGIGRDAALRSALPLVRQTVENIAAIGLPQSLTGPVARGDVETVRRHIQAIESRLPELVSLYKLLGREAVEVALEAGTLSKERAAELTALLQ